jgi:twitching motility two-component system response regulator PilH
MVAPRGGSDRLVCAGRAAGYNRVGDNTGTYMARILIVDDSPSQLMGIRRIVEKLGHDASTAEDGAAGVDAARREVPDLILMDVVMPNLNGFQATRAITRDPATRHIPVILVTTKDQDTDRVWGMRQGAKAYITKPFGEAELAEVIEQWLAGGPEDRNVRFRRTPAPNSDAGTA